MHKRIIEWRILELICSIMIKAYQGIDVIQTNDNSLACSGTHLQDYINSVTSNPPRLKAVKNGRRFTLRYQFFFISFLHDNLDCAGDAIVTSILFNFSIFESCLWRDSSIASNFFAFLLLKIWFLSNRTKILIQIKRLCIWRLRVVFGKFKNIFFLICCSTLILI